MLTAEESAALCVLLQSIGRAAMKLEVVRELLCEFVTFAPLVVFKRLDVRKFNRVSAEDLKRFVGSLDSQLTQVACELFVKLHDLDGDRELSYEDFLDAVMPQVNKSLRQHVQSRDSSRQQSAPPPLEDEIGFTIVKLIEWETRGVSELETLKYKLLGQQQQRGSIALFIEECFAAIDVERRGFITPQIVENFFETSQIDVSIEEIDGFFRAANTARRVDVLTKREFTEMIDFAPYNRKRTLTTTTVTFSSSTSASAAHNNSSRHREEQSFLEAESSASFSLIDNKVSSSAHHRRNMLSSTVPSIITVTPEKQRRTNGGNTAAFAAESQLKHRNDSSLNVKQQRNNFLNGSFVAKDQKKERWQVSTMVTAAEKRSELQKRRNGDVKATTTTALFTTPKKRADEVHHSMSSITPRHNASYQPEQQQQSRQATTKHQTSVSSTSNNYNLHPAKKPLPLPQHPVAAAAARGKSATPAKAVTAATATASNATLQSFKMLIRGQLATNKLLRKSDDQQSLSPMRQSSSSIHRPATPKSKSTLSHSYMNETSQRSHSPLPTAGRAAVVADGRAPWRPFSGNKSPFNDASRLPHASTPKQRPIIDNRSPVLKKKQQQELQGLRATVRAHLLRYFETIVSTSRDLRELRRILKQRSDFNAFTLFEMLDRQQRGELSAYDIHVFLATQSIAFHLTDIQLLIKSLHRCETAAGKLRFSAFLNAIAEEESARQYIQANQHIVKAVTRETMIAFVGLLAGMLEQEKALEAFREQMFIEKRWDYYYAFDILDSKRKEAVTHSQVWEFLDSSDDAAAGVTAVSSHDVECVMRYFDVEDGESLTVEQFVKQMHPRATSATAKH